MGRIRDYLRRALKLDEQDLREYVQAGLLVIKAELESELPKPWRMHAYQKAVERWRLTEARIVGRGYRPLTYGAFWERRDDPEAIERLEAKIQPMPAGRDVILHAEAYRPARMFTDEELRILSDRSPELGALQTPARTME